LFIMRELSEGAEFVKGIVSRELLSKDFRLPQLFIDKIQKAIDNGEIRAVDPVQLFITIIGSSLYFFMAEPMLKIFLGSIGSYDRNTFLALRKQHIFDIIINGIKPFPSKK